MTPTPPGAQYLPRLDVLALKFFTGDELPPGMGERVIRRPELGFSLRVTEGVEDGRLYGIAVHPASKHVDAHVLTSLTGKALEVVEAEDERDTVLVPLSPQSQLMAHTRIKLKVPDGSPFDVVLSRSGRLVGFMVSSARSRLPLLAS